MNHIKIFENFDSLIDDVRPVVQMISDEFSNSEITYPKSDEANIIDITLMINQNDLDKLQKVYDDAKCILDKIGYTIDIDGECYENEVGHVRVRWTIKDDLDVILFISEKKKDIKSFLKGKNYIKLFDSFNQ